MSFRMNYQFVTGIKVKSTINHWENFKDFLSFSYIFSNVFMGALVIETAPALLEIHKCRLPRVDLKLNALAIFLSQCMMYVQS